jgi:sulfate transport system permease protein
VLLTKRTILPGFGLSFGITLLYAGLVILFPLSMLAVKSSTLDWSQFWHVVTAPRVLASYRLSFGCAAVAAIINVVFGFILAWALVRYRFPGRRLIDTLVDLPFALPTAVAGITLTALYTPDGWIGQWLEKIGITAAFTPLGITIALIFIGLPFVVRTVQPVLEGIEPEMEEAAATFGASRLRTFRVVILPEILPALITGFALAFARGVGEYGSVVFIAGNLPMKTEITPLIIISKLEQYKYAEATAVAVSMLAISFLCLIAISLFERWRKKRTA